MPHPFPQLIHPLPTPQTITLAQIQELSAAYPLAAARLQAAPGKRAAPKSPEPLAALDAFRYEELPALIAGRRSEGGGGGAGGSGWMEKGELERLMGWKIHRGSFRPTLPALIRSNAAPAVITSTKTSLALLQSALSTTSTSTSTPAIRPALKAAAQLTGVGPATASLILSAACPADCPFLADELYAWFVGAKPAKYSEGEVLELVERMAGLRARLAREGTATSGEIRGVQAVQVERAVAVLAWVRAGRVEGWELEDGGEEVGKEVVKGVGEKVGKEKDTGEVKGHGETEEKKKKRAVEEKKKKTVEERTGSKIAKSRGKIDTAKTSSKKRAGASEAVSSDAGATRRSKRLRS